MANEHIADLTLGRRQLLKGAAAATAGVLGGTLLAACGGSSASSSAPSGQAVPSGKPKRGGTLMVGMITAGTSETLNPAVAIANPDLTRCLNLYDTLYDVDANLDTSPQLVVSGEPNSDATVWTFRLRPGVTFHNGKDLTADDVIATIRTWGSPTNFANGLVGSRIDIPNLRKVDNLTFQIPLKQANARLPQLLNKSVFNTSILPNGEFDKTRPIGTGPFMYQSFTPGQESTFVRNPNYFLSGHPYVDELKIITSFTDNGSLVNALLANQVAIVPLIPFSGAKQHASSPSSFQLLSSPSTSNMSPYMRVDVPPFNDVNVRQALRLLVDRQEMVDVVYDGFGTTLSDVMGNGCEFFASDLVRNRDIDQAKFLLKKAGQENLTVNFRVSDGAPNGTTCGTLFAQQAAAAGVKVNLINVPASQFFNTSTGYLTFPFAESFYDLIDSMQAFWSWDFLKNSPAQETHWNDPTTDALYAEATGTLDTAKAEQLWRELQLQQFNSGGYIVFGSYYNLDGLANNVRGLSASKAGNCDMMRFSNVWFA